MSTKNKITIDFLDNPQLADFFGGKQTGDSFEVTIKGTVGTVSGESMSGSLDEVCLPGDEMPMMDGEDDEGEDGEEGGSVTPTGEEPAAITIRARG